MMMTVTIFIFQDMKYPSIAKAKVNGHILAHAYLGDETGLLEITAETHTKYYTDHRGIAVILKAGIVL